MNANKLTTLAVSICVAAVTPSLADTFTWTGGGANKNWSTAANGVNWATTKYVPIAKTTAGVSFPAVYDADGRHFFAKSRNGITTLYFGKQRGLMIMVR